MSLDPGKEALFHRLREDISHVGAARTDKIAVDAACAAFKHRRWFPGYTYVGVDIDDTLLRQGIAAHPEDFAFCADVTKHPVGHAFAGSGCFHAYHYKC